jgi:predicted ArsR family transcriptional regulator
MSPRAKLVPPPLPPFDRRTHRALGSASRVRLLETLRAEGPLEVDQLVERVGLHLNTVRLHLDVLRKAGMVSAQTLPSNRPGRPRLVFAATGFVPDEGHPGAYRLLAGILTASLREREDGPDRATSAGRAAGRQLAEQFRPRALSITDRRTLVLSLLDRLGFAPRPAGEPAPDGSQVIGLHQCPFRDLVEDGSAIICAAHRGLIEGAFEGFGGSPDSVGLIPFASPGLCTVHFDLS